MTTAALTPSIEYIENGVTVSFPAPFRYIDPSHLVVERIASDGSVSLLAYGSAWTATAGPTDAGGTVTLAATTIGGRIRIRRSTPRAQEVNYDAGDTFPSETAEQIADKAMLIDQEQDVTLAELRRRALQVPVGETAPPVSSLTAAEGMILRVLNGRIVPFAVDALGAEAAAAAVYAAEQALEQNDSMLIGYRGSSVAHALDNITARKPRKFFSKIFASASGPVGYNIGMCGDSLASLKMNQLGATLDRALGGTAVAGDLNTQPITFQFGSRGGMAYSSNAVGRTYQQGQYAIWPTGEVELYTSGGGADYLAGGVNPTYNRFRVYYVKEPGAGAISLSAGGETVVAATSAAIGSGYELGVLDYFPGGASVQRATRISISGGPVRVISAVYENTLASGVLPDYRMGTGGMRLADAMNAALWPAYIASRGFDMLTFEIDDTGGAAEMAAFEPAFVAFVEMLNTHAPYADKLVIARAPRSSQTAEALAQGQFIRSVLAGQNNSWMYFDTYAAQGTWEQQNAFFPGGDGIHEPPASAFYGACLIAEQLGIDAATARYSPRRVNAAGNLPSFLGVGTRFGDGGRPGQSLEVASDNTFRIDWALKVQRSISFVDTDGNVFARFGRLGADHVLPSTYLIGDANSSKRIEIRNGTGRELYCAVNTSAANGMMPFRGSAFAPIESTLESITADLPANTHPTAYVRLTDGIAGLGPGAYLAGGASPSDYRFVLAARAVSAGSALPATPDGYLTVRIGGADRRIPFYA